MWKRMDEQWGNGWVADGKVAMKMGRELEDGRATAEKRREGGKEGGRERGREGGRNQQREVYPHAWRDGETTS